MHQGYGFDPQSGHIQELTNDCKNKWNNKSVFLFLPPLSLPLSKIKRQKRSEYNSCMMMIVIDEANFFCVSVEFKIISLVPSLKLGSHAPQAGASPLLDTLPIMPAVDSPTSRVPCGY